MAKPKVSVCIVTYNQHKYIKQCLDSLIHQKTNFLFEIIVGDDASTDGTAEIVKQYIEQYPYLIKGIFNKENNGFTRNYFSVHNAAKGDYIAHLDGDDYALPDKLQRQADFLDKNIDCSMVVHPMIYIESDGQIKKQFKKKYAIKADSQYYLKHFGYFSHSSKMYKFERLSYEFFKNEKVVLDSHLNLFHSLSGKIGFIPEVLGVYRCGVGILTNNSSQCHVWSLKTFQYALDFGINKKLVGKSYSKFYMQIIIYNVLRKKFDLIQDVKDQELILFQYKILFFLLKKYSKFFYYLFSYIKSIKDKLIKMNFFIFS